MIEKSLYDFNEALASREPIPSGGGASCLAGALAGCLAEMVANLTVGKKRYRQSEPQMMACKEKISQLRAELLRGIETDAEAFEPLSQAYSLPKDDPDRDEKLEACLRQAADAPYQVMVLTAQLIETLEEMRPISSKLVISDIATAAVLARGCLLGSCVNVKVNTKLMKDRNFAEALNQQVAVLCDEYSVRCDQIYASIMEEMN